MRTITYGNHAIQITGGFKDEVRYDGQVVSSRATWSGGTHIFSVKEDGEDVQYEVEYRTRWLGFGSWATVRRNGRVIFSDK
jgi:hypothetical protein